MKHIFWTAGDRLNGRPSQLFTQLNQLQKESPRKYSGLNGIRTMTSAMSRPDNCSIEIWKFVLLRFLNMLQSYS